MVLRLLEQRQRRPCEPFELVDGRVGPEEQAVKGGADAGEHLACLVSGRSSPLGGRGGNCCSFSVVPLEERLGEVELEHDVQPRRPGQLERPLEQPFGGPVVSARERAPAGDCKPVTGAVGQGRVGLSELLPVAGGLLEVVAEDLLQLDQLLSALLQPAGEALV